MTETMGTPQNSTHVANWKPWTVYYDPDIFQYHFYTAKGARHEGFATSERAYYQCRSLLSAFSLDVNLACTYSPSDAQKGQDGPSPAEQEKTPQTASTPAENGGSEGRVDPFPPTVSWVTQETATPLADIKASIDKTGYSTPIKEFDVGSESLSGTGTHAELREDRGRLYGPTKPNHDNIGMVWTGQLQAYFKMELPGVIPGFIVAQMMASLKLIRAANANVEDSYVDGAHYVEIAQEIDDREKVK